MIVDMSCCKKIELNIESFEIYGEKINISTYEDHWYSLKDIKFCPFCGTKITIIK